jgi:starch phosphorylase
MPEAWIERAKASMASVLPRFNAQRMVSDYCREMYCPALAQGRHLASEGGAHARALSEWKHRAHEAWSGLALRWLDEPAESVQTGEPVILRVAADLGGLAAHEVCLECILNLAGSEEPRIEHFQPEAGDGHE